MLCDEHSPLDTKEATNSWHTGSVYTLKELHELRITSQISLHKRQMAEAYHKEALRKQRIIDKKNAALARIAVRQV